MSLRFQSALAIEALPDDMVDNQWEVIMPKLDIANPYSQAEGGILSMFTSALTSYQPIVESITFGVTNFKTNTRRVRTMWCNVPEDIENYHDVNITMFCSANMLTQYYLSAWRQLVYNSEGEYYNPMSVYKKNIEVYFYGPGNIGTSMTAAAHFTLQGCFPAQQSNYQLDYKDDPQRLRITATFKVDKVVYAGSNARVAMATELVTSPTSIVDKAITTFTNNGSNYSVTDTYGYAGQSSGATNMLNNISDMASDAWNDGTVIKAG